MFVNMWYYHLDSDCQIKAKSNATYAGKICSNRIGGAAIGQAVGIVIGTAIAPVVDVACPVAAPFLNFIVSYGLSEGGSILGNEIFGAGGTYQCVKPFSNFVQYVSINAYTFT